MAHVVNLEKKPSAPPNTNMPPVGILSFEHEFPSLLNAGVSGSGGADRLPIKELRSWDPAVSREVEENQVCVLKIENGEGRKQLLQTLEELVSCCAHDINGVSVLTIVFCKTQFDIMRLGRALQRFKSCVKGMDSYDMDRPTERGSFIDLMCSVDSLVPNGYACHDSVAFLKLSVFVMRRKQVSLVRNMAVHRMEMQTSVTMNKTLIEDMKRLKGMNQNLENRLLSYQRMCNIKRRRYEESMHSNEAEMKSMIQGDLDLKKIKL